MGGPAGEKTTLELKGWNLRTNKLTVDTAGREVGVHPIRVHNAKLTSNHVPFAIDSLPECLEVRTKRRAGQRSTRHVADHHQWTH